MRSCKCGCGGTLTGRQARWASEGCRKAFERGRAPANADTTRTRRPPGLQVSYRKAVEAIVKGFTPHMYGHWAYPKSFEDDVRQSAEVCLRAALSDRQRQILEQREAA